MWLSSPFSTHVFRSVAWLFACLFACLGAADGRLAWPSGGRE